MFARIDDCCRLDVRCDGAACLKWEMNVQQTTHSTVLATIKCECVP